MSPRGLLPISSSLLWLGGLVTVFFLKVLGTSKLPLFLNTRYFSSAFSFLKCILEAGELSHQVKAFTALEEDPSLLPVSMLVGSQPPLTPTPRGFKTLFRLWKPLTCTNPQTDINKYTKLKMKSSARIQWMKYDPSIYLMPAHSPIILLNHSPVADHSGITEYETAFCRHNDL